MKKVGLRSVLLRKDTCYFVLSLLFWTLHIFGIPQSLLGDYLEFSDLDINTSYSVDKEKVEQRLIDYSKNFDEGKVHATLVDLYSKWQMKILKLGLNLVEFYGLEC